jgi:hypothetical protein
MAGTSLIMKDDGSIDVEDAPREEAQAIYEQVLSEVDRVKKSKFGKPAVTVDSKDAGSMQAKSVTVGERVSWLEDKMVYLPFSLPVDGEDAGSPATEYSRVGSETVRLPTAAEIASAFPAVDSRDVSTWGEITTTRKTWGVQGDSKWVEECTTRMETPAEEAARRERQRRKSAFSDDYAKYLLANKEDVETAAEVIRRAYEAAAEARAEVKEALAKDKERFEALQEEQERAKAVATKSPTPIIIADQQESILPVLRALGFKGIHQDIKFIVGVRPEDYHRLDGYNHKSPVFTIGTIPEKFMDYLRCRFPGVTPVSLDGPVLLDDLMPLAAIDRGGPYRYMSKVYA